MLKSYGWIDRDKGVVHIPIDRAIEILAERGLPVRAAKSAPAADQNLQRRKEATKR
jgi:hypothetical protein